MFRISSNVCRARCLLQRSSISKLSIESACQYADFKKSSQPERETCPKQNIPPRPPPKSDAMFWGAMTLLCFAGGFAVYAHGDPETRNWLSLYAPWIDNIIAVAYQENMTYKEFATSLVEDVKKSVVNYFEEPGPCMPVKDYGESGDDGEPCELVNPPVITKDVCEMERCLKELGDSVIHNYMTARDACQYYNKLVASTLGSKFSFKGLKNLREAMEERKDLIKTSMANIEKDQQKFDYLCRYLSCGVTDQKEKVDKAKELLKEYQNKITILEIQYKYDNDLSIALDEQWMELEPTMDRFTSEVNAFYPLLDFMEEKLSLEEGNIDLLLMHTLKYIKHLQAELYEKLEAMTQRVDRGLLVLSQDENELLNRKKLIDSKYHQGKKAIDLELNLSGKGERSVEIIKDVDKLTKEALKEQRTRHEKSLISRAQEEEKRIMKSYDKMVAERVKAKTEQLVKERNLLKSKMDIVSKRIEEKSLTADETKKSQDLWAAAASLLAATKKGEHRVNVSKELWALAKASGNKDKIVVAVLNAIPQSVWDDGLVPESVLREKYSSMESVALKVALVEHDGAPLFIYMFSLLQSMLLFFKLSTIPQTELDNPPKEPIQGYDTFDLLLRARYYINRGDIATAVKYVSALEGASRGAAATWYEDARALVETRQAAETVIAHAVAIGLKYV